MFRRLNWSDFQGVNKLFVLPFENNYGRTGHTGYSLPKAEIKDYNVMIYEQKLIKID